MKSIDATLQALVQRLVRDLAELVTQVRIDEVLALSGKGAPARPRKIASKGSEKRPVGRPPGRKKSGENRKPVTRSRPKKQGRRSSETIEALVEKIASVVRDAGPEGTTARNIASALRMAPSDLNRSMKLAMTQGQIRKEGDRRTTRYFEGQQT
jgi:hypothetical protein